MRIIIYISLFASLLTAQDSLTTGTDTTMITSINVFSPDSTVLDTMSITQTDTLESIEDLLMDIPEPDLVDTPEIDNQPGGIVTWLKASENRYVVGGVTTAIVVILIVLNSGGDDSIPDDIGGPPDWPDN